MNSFPSSPGWARPGSSRESSIKSSGPAASSELGDDKSSLSSASDYNKCVSCRETESTMEFVRCAECKRPWHRPCWPSGASPICPREKCKTRAGKRKARAEASATQQRTGLSNSSSLPSRSTPSSASDPPRLPKGPSCEVLGCKNAPLSERVAGIVLCKLHSMSKRYEQASKLANSTRTEVVRKPIIAANVHPALRPEDRQLLNKVKRPSLTKRTSTSGPTGPSNNAQKKAEFTVAAPNFRRGGPQYPLLQREEGFEGANVQSARLLPPLIHSFSAQRTSGVRINNVEKDASIFPLSSDDLRIVTMDSANDKIPESLGSEPPLPKPFGDFLDGWEPHGRVERPGVQTANEMSATFNTPTLPIPISSSKTYQSVPAHDPKVLSGNGIQDIAKNINSPGGKASSPKRRKITTDHNRDHSMVHIDSGPQKPALPAVQRSLTTQGPALSAGVPLSSNTPSMDKGIQKDTASLTKPAIAKDPDVNRSTSKLPAPSAISPLESPIKFNPPTKTHLPPPILPLNILNPSFPSESPSPERIANSLAGSVLGSEGYAPPLDHLKSPHQARQASLDENKIDRIISQYQPNEDPDYEPTDCELISSQNWGHINPRETWPPPKPSMDWFADKRAEIIARNDITSKSARRKKNFGVLLTEETKAGRRAKGWNIHQEREVEDTEGRMECASRLEEWTGLKVKDFEPGVVGGKLVVREKEGTRTADGARVKMKDELRAWAAE